MANFDGGKRESPHHLKIVKFRATLLFLLSAHTSFIFVVSYLLEMQLQRETCDFARSYYKTLQIIFGSTTKPAVRTEVQPLLWRRYTILSGRIGVNWKVFRALQTGTLQVAARFNSSCCKIIDLNRALGLPEHENKLAVTSKPKKMFCCSLKCHYTETCQMLLSVTIQVILNMTWTTAHTTL